MHASHPSSVVRILADRTDLESEVQLMAIDDRASPRLGVYVLTARASFTRAFRPHLTTR